MKSKSHPSVMTPPTRSSAAARRRKQRQQQQQHYVPRLTPASSESSTSSPDESIFKGAEILRSELLSGTNGDLWSVAESSTDHDNPHHLDDDWSNPWSLAEGHVKTPSPTHAARPKSTRMAGPPQGQLPRSPPTHVDSPDSFLTSSSVEISGKTRSYPDDNTEDWFADFESVEPSVFSQEASLLNGVDASSRHDCSVVSSDSEPPPPPPSRPPPSESDSDLRSLLTPASDATPTTTMGRENSLRFKTVTYLVQPNLDELTYNEDDGFHDDEQDYNENDHDYNDDKDHYRAREKEPCGYVPSKYQHDGGSSRSFPLSVSHEDSFFDDYSKLTRDAAYLHAQQAGVLWQTLVGQHVKFPKTWWKGERSPPMGLDAEFSTKHNWRYIARHCVFDNASLMEKVKHRSSPGRLLLHIVIRDLMTCVPLQDVAIGCLHPNARGIRQEARPDRDKEACREVWMAIRKRPASLQEEAPPSLIDRILTRGRAVENIAQDSPLGGNKRRVNNTNMKAVFGEEPPVCTVMIDESDLYERLMVAEEMDSFAAPALVLLNEFT